MDAAPRRRRPDTRATIERVALERFAEQGYDGTSLREIAERVGITKAALYHHFRSKDGIVAALLEARADAVEELLAEARAEPVDADRARRVLDRWLDGATPERLRGIRFAAANPGLLGRIAAPAGMRMAAAFADLVDELAGPDADERTRLTLRMAFLAVEHALAAARGTDATDEDVLTAARDAAARLLAG